MSSIAVTPHEHLVITTSSPELLAIEATWTTAGELPPPHFHPFQDEHFEVHEGSLLTIVDGVERMIEAGESFDVPRGAVHQMTAAAGGARATWEVRPALATESFFRDMAAAHGNKLRQLAVAARHPDEFRLTGALGAIVAALRALRPSR
jgi:quercetin dioxygenase-like cupin family protein